MVGMIRVRGICAAAVLLGALWSGALRAQTPVSIELVLAIDTSESVDIFEYDLLKYGMAQAFRDPDVIELIELQDGVAVTLFQWSSGVDERYMTPWRLLRGEADCLAFATLLEGTKRDPFRGFTGIGNALEFATRILRSNAYEGRHTKIDISGDGISNVGLDPAVVRKASRNEDIQINGLPILTPTYEGKVPLDQYYKEYVIHGPGAFMETAEGYDDYARAFKRKLRREITPAISLDPPKRRSAKLASKNH